MFVFVFFPAQANPGGAEGGGIRPNEVHSVSCSIVGEGLAPPENPAQVRREGSSPSPTQAHHIPQRRIVYPRRKRSPTARADVGIRPYVVRCRYGGRFVNRPYDGCTGSPWHEIKDSGHAGPWGEGFGDDALIVPRTSCHYRARFPSYKSKSARSGWTALIDDSGTCCYMGLWVLRRAARSRGSSSGSGSSSAGASMIGSSGSPSIWVVKL